MGEVLLAALVHQLDHGDHLARIVLREDGEAEHAPGALAGLLVEGGVEALVFVGVGDVELPLVVRHPAHEAAVVHRDLDDEVDVYRSEAPEHVFLLVDDEETGGAHVEGLLRSHQDLAKLGLHLGELLLPLLLLEVHEEEVSHPDQAAAHHPDGGAGCPRHLRDPQGMLGRGQRRREDEAPGDAFDDAAEEDAAEVREHLAACRALEACDAEGVTQTLVDGIAGADEDGVVHYAEANHGHRAADEVSHQDFGGWPAAGGGLGGGGLGGGGALLRRGAVGPAKHRHAGAKWCRPCSMGKPGLPLTS
mmetsp:Transcript_111605/g.240600  ORF Transcript_111605/g.240600 Transcript_111605/m.240600 type:complete len:305 (-) Transcript_111605:55-969(-)